MPPTIFNGWGAAKFLGTNLKHFARFYQTVTYTQQRTGKKTKQKRWYLTVYTLSHPETPFEICLHCTPRLGLWDPGLLTWCFQDCAWASTLHCKPGFSTTEPEFHSCANVSGLYYRLFISGCLPLLFVACGWPPKLHRIVSALWFFLNRRIMYGE